MKKLMLLVVAVMTFGTSAFADILADLGSNVDSSVFIYTSGGSAITGTLDSVGTGSGGVTVLTPSGGGTTEIVSASITAFTVTSSFDASKSAPPKPAKP